MKEDLNNLFMRRMEYEMDQLDILTSSVYVNEAQKMLDNLRSNDDNHSWELIDNKNKIFKFFHSWTGLGKFNSIIKRNFIINPDGLSMGASFVFI